MPPHEGWMLSPPGGKARHLRSLICDFTGTLALDGRLIPGVAPRLKRLGRQGRVVILTADTFGTCSKVLRDLPVEVHVIQRGIDKARLAKELKLSPYAMIGNGRNDGPAMGRAVLGIAVVGPEGCATELLAQADLVVRDIRDGLDLLLNSRRLTATLRA